MPKNNNKNKSTKNKLHPRNKHRTSYDFKKLIAACPDLTPFVQLNKYENESIDFHNPEAVKLLNKALLIAYYDLKYWDIPNGYLCPPIPGRADYIHYAADLLSEANKENIPKGNRIKCLDIGVGANCIYPVIGNKEYGWSFVGSDIDEVSIQSCNKIISENEFLKNKIEIRKQTDVNSIFKNVIQKDEYFDLTICNPPFHSSAEEANAGTFRKLKNLKKKNPNKTVLNFGGKNNELWCKGGEVQFVNNMIEESLLYRSSCFWFTTLISKEAHLKKIKPLLKKANAKEIKIIPMGQGNKISRIVAWSFLSIKQQKIWSEMRWVT